MPALSPPSALLLVATFRYFHLQGFCDLTILIPARTVSVLATTLLHPPTTARPARLLAFGAGAQIRAHILLLLSAYPTLTHVTILTRNFSARHTTLLATLHARVPSVRFVSTVTSFPLTDLSSGAHILREIFHDADIIITATPSTVVLFPGAWTRPGQHFVLIGSYTPDMHEVDTALIRRTARVVVDSRRACLIEAGELLAAGLRPEDVVELGELIRPADADAKACLAPSWTPDEQQCAAVRAAGDVTIFKSVGVGAQDAAIAHAVVERAMQMGVGTVVTDYDT
jgi:ornithine cyclodeaminase/alanine dehydrogenase-like protein (mu-crystallin family)